MGIPKVQELLKKADDILGYSITDMCLKGPEAKLEETQYCQPAMFIAGLAGLEKLRQDNPEAAAHFQVAAGLSLGEYTALCAAGVFTFEDGLTLVQQRGKYMQEAAEVGKELDAMLPKMKPPNNTVYMNATAQPVPPGTAPKEIVEKLKMQLTSPVLWEPSVKAMIKAG